MRTAAIWLLLLGASVFAQDAKKKGPRNFDAAVDQVKVDAAIKKGVAYLKSSDDNFSMVHGTELALLALINAGRDIIPEQDPFFQDLLKKTLESKLTHTYNAAITAMCLEELDRVKYQKRIWQCAQFLVDNMGPDGEWKYSEPDPFSDEFPTPKPLKRDVASADASKPRDFSAPDGSKRVGKPKVVQTMAVIKRRDGPAEGDASNAQYAALGLRACHDSGILIPEEVIRKAMKWWVDSRAPAGAEGKATASGPGAPPRSWGYVPTKSGCGCMTAGAIGTLSIYHYILDNDGGRKKSWMVDPVIQGGLSWMAQNFKATEMGGVCDALVGYPGERKKGDLYYYWLYAVERAGMLYGREQFGTHAWYPLGAEILLKTQGADGSWNEEGIHSRQGWNTSLAILFLKRATRPLNDVASVDKYSK